MRSHVQTSSVFRVGKEGLTCGLHRPPQSREKVLWPHDIQGSRLCQERALRNLARCFNPEWLRGPRLAGRDSTLFSPRGLQTLTALTDCRVQWVFLTWPGSLGSED